MGSGNGLEPPYGMVLRPLLRTLRGGGGESGSRAWKLFPRLWRMSSFVALGGEEGITNQASMRDLTSSSKRMLSPRRMSMVDVPT